MDLIEVSENQNRHPWELSRTSCVLMELKRLKIHGNVLDIGCGDSYFDKNLLNDNSELSVYGVDINLIKEFHEGNLHALNSLEHLPRIKFDYVLMMDVLEHIENDFSYLDKIRREYLSEDGVIFITVPAFQKLYSLHDKELKHFRRYNHKQLKMLIKKSGLKEESWSYFYFSLIFARILTKNKTENLSCWHKSADNFVTKLIVWILNADFIFCRFFSKFHVHFPGLSLMTVCRKN